MYVFFLVRPENRTVIFFARGAPVMFFVSPSVFEGLIFDFCYWTFLYSCPDLQNQRMFKS